MTSALSAPAMAQITCLSGFVLDPSGNPVPGVDLDFIDPVTGVKLVTPGDNTDALGFYNVCLLPGIFDVTFAPPAGSRLLGARYARLDLTASRELTIFLQPGLLLTGVVTDTLGQPAGDVDIDVDSVAGGRVFTPTDNTDPITGRYSVAVPPGTFRLRYDPPPGSRLRGLQIDTVSVFTDTTVNVSLLAGMLLTGRVTGELGLGQFNIDVDLREQSTGDKVRLSNNSTDTTGNYSVAAPAGTFELRFAPPRGSPLVGVLVDSFVIAADRVWDQVLQTGAVVEVHVQDSAGHPIADADLDFKLEFSGQKVFTPNDNTDADGITQVAILADTYSLQIDPPPGSVFDRLEQPGLVISGDTSIVAVLPEVARVAFRGRIMDSTGVGIAGAQVGLLSVLTGKSVYVPNDLTDSSGAFTAAVPVGFFHVLFAPPAGSRYVAARLDSVTFASDTTWSAIVLQTGVAVTVTAVDVFGNPVVGADIDCVSETTGREVYTPSDNVASDGRAVVVVPPDLYTVVVEPPAGALLYSATLRGQQIASDVQLAVVLLSTDGTLPEDAFVLWQNYPNPFNGVTSIPYTILEESDITLDIINLLGQQVVRLKSGRHAVGVYSATWDGTNEQGRPVASGLYLYALTDSQSATAKKLILLR
jgi:hypothetical protein